MSIWKSLSFCSTVFEFVELFVYMSSMIEGVSVVCDLRRLHTMDVESYLAVGKARGDCENMAGNDSGSHLLGTQAVVSVDQRHTFGRVTLLGEPIGSNDSLSPCNEGGYIISLLKRNCLGG